MSFLSRLNPVPQFPPYTGPYDVGSFELEIPASSLGRGTSPSDVRVETVQFRVFYPADKAAPTDNIQGRGGGGGGVGGGGGWWWWFGGREKPAGSKPVRWLPEPYQREYLSGYARFMGVNSGFAEIVSYLPRALYYISLPAIANAPLSSSSLGGPGKSRFPTMVFSHGLGGTRLAYSHICGSIASYGVIVVAPEHRDGSCPVTFVKMPSTTTSTSSQEPERTRVTQVSGTRPEKGQPGIGEASALAGLPQRGAGGRIQVDYTAYPHQVSEETENGRNRQLEIRLWELRLIYSALSKIDAGKIPQGAMISGDESSMGVAIGQAGEKLLGMFKDKLDVQDPGKLIWSGHSFGAATMIQFVKSICYVPPANSKPLFIPEPEADGALPLQEQVTADSPILLLDPWCLPLLGKRTSHLFKHPLPQISAGKPSLVLAIMSEEFFRWKENLRGVKRILSPDPGRKRGGARNELFEKWDLPDVVPDHAVTTKTSHHEPLRPPCHEATSMSSIEDEKDPGRQIIPPTATPSPTPLQNSSHHVSGREPRFYYTKKSQHLSQSDFGILFPRVIRKAQNPARILELNVRAVVQWLREAGYSQRVAKCQDLEGAMEPSIGDVDDVSRGIITTTTTTTTTTNNRNNRNNNDTTGWDWNIFEDGDEALDGWGRIELDEFEHEEEKEERDPEAQHEGQQRKR